MYLVTRKCIFFLKGLKRLHDDGKKEKGKRINYYWVHILFEEVYVAYNIYYAPRGDLTFQRHGILLPRAVYVREISSRKR